jgi:hypothetical protein
MPRLSCGAAHLRRRSCDHSDKLILPAALTRPTRESPPRVAGAESAR